MSGTVAAQLVTFAATPLLTRLYSQEAYGIAGVYTAVVNTASVLTTGKYELAIPVAKSERQASEILSLCIVVAAAFCILLAIPTFLSPVWIADLFRAHNVADWLAFLPVSLFLWGAYQSLSLWCNRDGNFQALASSRFFRSVFTVVAALAFAHYIRNAGGLILAGVIGQASALVWIGRAVFRKGAQLCYRDKKSLWTHARDYRDFPLFHASSSLIDNYALAAPLLFMNWFAGAPAAGSLNLVMLVLGTPVNIMSESVGQVFFQRATIARRQGMGVRPLVVKYLTILASVSAPVMVILWLAGPWAFGTLFGSSWKNSGEMVRWLALPYGLRLVISPLSWTLPAVGKIRWGAFWKVGYGMTTTVALFIAGKSGAPAILSAVLFNDLIMYTVYLCIILRAAKLSAGDLSLDPASQR